MHFRPILTFPLLLPLNCSLALQLHKSFAKETAGRVKAGTPFREREAGHLQRPQRLYLSPHPKLPVLPL